MLLRWFRIFRKGMRGYMNLGREQRECWGWVCMEEIKSLESFVWVLSKRGVACYRVLSNCQYSGMSRLKEHGLEASLGSDDGGPNLLYSTATSCLNPGR